MEVFQNIFHCCSDSKKGNQLRMYQSFKQVLIKKQIKTRIISNQSNNHNNINVSIITFANIKVGESYKTLPEFDTEVMNSHELKLTGELFWGKEIAWG